jgi:TRAP-type C4-dicarboxylate transport system permease small subunit
MDLIGKALDAINTILAGLAAVLLLFVTFSIAYSVFTRELNLPTPVWVVQFNEYALLWITFMATAWVLAKNQHVTVQLATQRVGRTGQRVLGIIHSIVGAALCGVLCWYGIHTTSDHFARKVVDVGSVDFPKAVVILIIPVGFFLLTIQFLRNLIRHLKADTSGSPDDNGEPDSHMNQAPEEE